MQQRNSLDSATRFSEAATSEYSNDSYESASSVRLENEVIQLHSFYNEKALIIEKKLKTQFHVRSFLYRLCTTQIFFCSQVSNFVKSALKSLIILSFFFSLFVAKTILITNYWLVVTVL